MLLCTTCQELIRVCDLIRFMNLKGNIMHDSATNKRGLTFLLEGVKVWPTALKFMSWEKKSNEASRKFEAFRLMKTIFFMTGFSTFCRRLVWFIGLNTFQGCGSQKIVHTMYNLSPHFVNTISAGNLFNGTLSPLCHGSSLRKTIHIVREPFTKDVHSVS